MEQVTIFTRGIAKAEPGLAAIGVHLVDAEGKVLREVSEAIGNATTAYAEYFAVQRGLEVAKELFGNKTKQVHFELKLESELVKGQLAGEREVTDVGLVGYFIETHNLRVSHFPNLTFTQLCREDNKVVDRLVRNVLDA